MMDALGAGAQALGLSLERFCRDIAFLSHGTTVGTNTIIQKNGAKVGLITTRGHEDAIHIMRGSRGYSGRDIRKVVHFPETSKPAPIVPKRLIRGVSERVDCFGEIVVPLERERKPRRRSRSSSTQGVQAIAICFLWSFRNPQHELRVREMVQDDGEKRVRHLLGRHRAEMGRVRARHGHRAERLPRPGHVRLSRSGWTARSRVSGTHTACRSRSAAAARCRWSAPAKRRC